MGYLFLAISLIAGVTKGYCGKKTSGYISGYKTAMLANTIRMMLCILIGVLVIIAGGNISQLRPNSTLIAISVLSGIATSVFVVSWLVVVKKNAYMMVDVFLMLGVLVPIIIGQFVFKEETKLTQWLGIGVLLVATLIMCSYNNSIKEKMGISTIILLIVCGVSNGLADFSQKLFINQLADIPVSVFNFYTYIFSSVVLGGFYVIFSIKEGSYATDDSPKLKHIFGYIAVMSICLFVNSYFKTKAAGFLNSAQLYPLNQGLALTLSSIMSATLFHEHMSLKCIIGLAVSFVGLLIINVL
ncbi:MAG: EamA family transporter [Eubacteriales bacterium]|nr:EamA family transporter [Eubacteriales bacterium]